MGGGKTKGGGIPAPIQEAAQGLLDIGNEQLGIGMPLLEAGGGIAQDVLRTGMSDAFRPAILSSVEATRRRGSEEIRGMESDLARSGVTGTQLQDALTPARVNLADQVGAIPSQIMAPIFQAGTQGAFGTVEQGLQSLQAGMHAAAAGNVPGRQTGGLGGALGGALSGAGTGTMTYGWPYGTIVGAVAGGAKGAK